MANISIKISKTGLNKVLKDLEDAPRRIKSINDKAGKEIAIRAQTVAQYNYDNAAYDGINDVEVSIKKTGDDLWTVVAEGESAPYIEYGTGRDFRGTGLGKVPARYQGPAPTQAQNGVYKGNQKRWGFYEFPGTQYTAGGFQMYKKTGQIVGITFGNPPNDCMYHAKQTAAKEALDVIKDKYLTGKGIL